MVFGHRRRQSEKQKQKAHAHNIINDK